MAAFVSVNGISLSKIGHLRTKHYSPHQNKSLASSPETRKSRLPIKSALDALIFDCDGVLADTERDAHRVAFNIAFDERKLDTVWDEKLYGKLLETGGGKERMTAYWNGLGQWPAGADSESEQRDLVKALHARKTELFMELVAAGKVPLREGVQRLVREAVEAGIKVAVCSTSNEKAVNKIVEMLGNDASTISVYAGDIVAKKKPSPDVYNLAAEKLNLNPSNVCVIEDSYIGVQAARAAGMPVVVTKSTYTKDEDFSDAQKVLNSLDDPVTTLENLTQMVEGLNDINRPKGGMGQVNKFRSARQRYGSSYL
ncbi:HAD-like hydrolase family protein [Gracilaria domingensis]|nr:HAD-like hydrolase family protein [Gracilaria domingensis]